MNSEIEEYNNKHSLPETEICNVLYNHINQYLPEAESKIWHAHPVWFLDGNPIVGYSKLKNCIRLLFWSGQSFDEPALINGGKFKAAEIRYTTIKEIDLIELQNWINKSRNIQWDYKNIVKRKGRLEHLK